MKINIEYEIGDNVKLPLGEIGKIIKINTKTLDWCSYKVKLRKINPFFNNKINQIHEFKKEQLKPILTDIKCLIE